MTRLARYVTLFEEHLQQLDLRRYGYSYSGVEEKSHSQLGAFLSAAFKKGHAERAVDIDYFPEAPKPGTRPALAVFVRGSKDKSFYLPDFLTYKGAGPDRKRELSLSDHLGPPEEKLRKTIAVVAHLFHTDLRKVISGEEWIEVPMDWEDYK
jgi:hypothetical protein